MRKLVLAAVLVASPASAITRDEVAKRYAPVIYQEIHDPRDLLAAFDFDGNWAGDDNGANGTCAADPTQCLAGTPCENGCPLVGTVYYTVIETSSHWFVQYMPYHALDTKSVEGHEHDTESALVVVSKTAGLQAYEMLFHTGWFIYAAPGVMGGAKQPDGALHLDADGRPMIYMQQVGHGMCGGFSPPNDANPELQLECFQTEDPHIANTGVVYHPDRAAGTPVIASGTAIDAGYTLVEMLDSLWARRKEVGPGKTYQSLADFEGERCSELACPKQYGSPFMSVQTDSPGPPWNQEPGVGVTAIGDQFFDPAFTMNVRLGFPQPFALDYCHNPYVGIVAQCEGDPKDAGAPPGQDAGAAPPPAHGSDGSGSADAPAAGASGSGCATSPATDAAPLGFALVLLALRRRRLSAGARWGS